MGDETFPIFLQNEIILLWNQTKLTLKSEIYHPLQVQKSASRFFENYHIFLNHCDDKLAQFLLYESSSYSFSTKTKVLPGNILTNPSFE